MEGNTTTTAQAAVKDFEQNIWPSLEIKRNPHNRDYNRIYHIIVDNRKGDGVTIKRATWLLETYAPDRYKVETTFKIIAND